MAKLRACLSHAKAAAVHILRVLACEPSRKLLSWKVSCWCCCPTQHLLTQASCVERVAPFICKPLAEQFTADREMFACV